MGKELADIGQASGSIATVISSGDFISQVSSLRSSMEEIQSSKDTVSQEIVTINGILEELKKLAGDDMEKPAEKQGKVAKATNAALNLLVTVTKILDELVQLMDKVDQIINLDKADVDGITELGKGVKGNIEALVGLIKEATEQVKEIIDIVKGGGGGDKKGGESKKEKVKDTQPKKSDGVAKSAKAGDTTDKKDKDGEEEKGCWASFKSCCCCCC